MPRPKRPRYIVSRPVTKGFIPDGTPKTGEAILSLEEFEAIRLSDFESMDQSQAATMMNVSRQTFGRILKSARFNLSKALVTGQRLKVKGGCYEMSDQRVGRGRGHGRKRQNETGILINTIDKRRDIMVENNRNQNKQDIDQGRGTGQGRGSGQGRGTGQGQGTGQGRGSGQGRGRGQGRKKGNGSRRNNI